MSNYNVALFGPDAEGFLTIQHNVVLPPVAVAAIGGGGAVAIDDGTDRVRNVERLQFADGTVAIDKNGNMISSSFNPIADPNYATLYAPYYDAVPFGTPTVTETDPDGNAVDPTVAVVVGNTLHANVATISDFDGITTRVQLPVAVCRRHIRRVDRFHGRDQRGLHGPQLPAHPGARGAGEGQLRRRQGLYRTAHFRLDGCRDHPAGHRQHGADHSRGNAVQRHLEHDRASRARRSTTSRRSPRVSGSIFTDQQTAANALIYNARPARRLAAVQRAICPSTSIR